MRAKPPCQERSELSYKYISHADSAPALNGIIIIIISPLFRRRQIASVVRGKTLR